MAIQVPVYRQQVAFGGAPDASGTNERMRPTGVGEALEGLGEAGLRMAANAERINKENAASNAIFAVSDTNLAMEEAFQKAKETAQPGAPQFMPNLLKRFDEEIEKRATALPDELTRKAYRERMAGNRDNFGARALAWESQENKRNKIDNFSKTADNDANQLFAADAASRDVVYRSQQEQFNQALDVLELEPGDKEKLREEAKNKRSYAAVQGDLRDRPDKTQDWLTAGGGGTYFAMLRSAESGGRNVGSDSSSAFGPYQFTSGTWSNVITRHPDLGLTAQDRFNPAKQEIAIRAFTADNAAALKSAGLPQTDVNLYMMHFLGEAGGPRMIRALASDPQGNAKQYADASAVAANPAIFNGRSVEQVFKLFGGKFGDKETWRNVSDAPSYYSDIPFAKRDMLYGQAETEMNKRRVQGEAAFRQRVENAVAEYTNNGVASSPPSEQEFVAAMGAQRGAVAYGEFQANAIGAEASYRVQRMPLAEGAQYVESLKPKQGDAFYAEKARGYLQAKEIADRVRTSALTDFGQHVATFNAEARDALGTAMTSTDPAAAQAAAQNYARIIDTEATRLGVPAAGRGFLPKSYSQQIAATLDQKLTKDADAATVVQTLNEFKQRWGENWPRIYGELKETLSPTLQVVTSGVQPRAAMTLVSVHSQSFDDLSKILPKSSKSEIITSLQEAFQPFVTSTMWQQSSLPTVTNFFEQAKKLAAVYTAQGETTGDAATRAFEDVLGFKYRMFSSSAANVRVPKPQDFPELEHVLRFERLNIIDRRIAANPNDPVTKLDPESANRLVKQQYADDSKWVTLPDESGVGLMRGKELRPDKDGKPIVYTWAELKASRDRMQSRASEEDADRQTLFGFWSLD